MPNPTERTRGLMWASALLLSACVDGGDTLATRSAAVGVAPVNQVPGPQTTNEDSPLFLSLYGSNAIVVADEDNGFLTVQLTSTNGRYFLYGTSGITVSGQGTSN